MAKKYVTWENITVNPNRKIHINTDNFWEYNWEWIFKETWFTDWNWLYIWMLDNETIPTTPFDFKIIEKTEEEINILLNTWYWWDVTVNDFVFTDNRPTDI